MSVQAAYIGMVLIWSTTPLAVKWSGEGAGFLFGVTGRTVLSAIVALGVAMVFRVRLPWHRRARNAYLVAGLSTYGAMIPIYWAAQFVSSGWISVLLGLSPIMTGVMASAWLGGSLLSYWKLGGLLLGVAGLAVMFGTGLAMSHDIFLGIGGVLLGTLVHSASLIWLKRLTTGIHGMAVTTGGLLVSAPLFLLTWFLTGSQWPAELAPRAAYSIVYLAVLGTVIGRSLFFHVLKNVEVVQVTLITLVTPVMALLLGNWLNHEPLGWRTWLGAGLILLGLSLFELPARWQARAAASRPEAVAVN